MSLKGFHIVFIIVATLATLGFAWWTWNAYQFGAEGDYTIPGVISLLLGIGLIVYGYWFLKKLQNLK